jgi:glycine/D-amino acid oxidase-like deaminating enzyme
VAAADARDDMEANMAIQRRLAIEVELVDAVALRDIHPSVGIDDGVVVAHEPDAGVAHAMATCHGFGVALQRLGVEIWTDTTVTAITHRSGHVTGVETDRGTHTADVIVVAPGAFAHLLLCPLGIDLPMVPSTSRVAIFRWPLEPDFRPSDLSRTTTSAVSGFDRSSGIRL